MGDAAPSAAPRPPAETPPERRSFEEAPDRSLGNLRATDLYRPGPGVLSLCSNHRRKVGERTYPESPRP